MAGIGVHDGSESVFRMVRNTHPGTRKEIRLGRKAPARDPKMASSISRAFIDHSTFTRNMAAEFEQLYFFRSNKSGPNEAGLN